MTTTIPSLKAANAAHGRMFLRPEPPTADEVAASKATILAALIKQRVSATPVLEQHRAELAACILVPTADLRGLDLAALDALVRGERK